jgi:ABC transporter substrate binding protein
MRRRDFISVIVGATAWPLAARAQETAMPVIGFLTPTAADAIFAAFRRGLAEAGYVEGKNLAIEYRFANFKLELLPELADDLVRLNVSIIFAPSPEAGAAAKNATTSIPVVALDLESDPLAKGYVKSFARPGGNMTGMFLDIPQLSGNARAFQPPPDPRHLRWVPSPTARCRHAARLLCGGCRSRAARIVAAAVAGSLRHRRRARTLPLLGAGNGSAENALGKLRIDMGGGRKGSGWAAKPPATPTRSTSLR